MIGIMDYSPVKQQKGLKENKLAQRSPKKEVANPWALWEMESKQEWAEGAQKKELSK